MGNITHHATKDFKVAVVCRYNPKPNKICCKYSNLTTLTDQKLDNLLGDLNISGEYKKDTHASKCIGKKEGNYILFSKSSFLSILFLCKKSVCELCPDIGNIPIIQEIHACCNFISSIPVEIGNLHQLKIISLANNKLREIPKEISRCRKIQEINLSYNMLETLPDELSSLESIEVLNLEGNMFSEVPRCIFKMKNLKKLNLLGNKIISIPIEIMRLENIVNIELDKTCRTGYKNLTKSLSLREIAARAVCKTDLYCFGRDKLARIYMSNINFCSFCGEPYFKENWEFVDKQTHFNCIHSVSYKMCKKHFSDKKEKIRKMALQS